MTGVESREYEVLYFKRTMKVHKTKGVSKMDGVLTIFPSTCHVRLDNADESNDSNNDKDDNDAKKSVMVQSTRIYDSVNKEIAKRELETDEVVNLGGYQVQIVASKSTFKPTKLLAVTSRTSTKTTMLRRSTPLVSKSSTLTKKFVTPVVKKSAVDGIATPVQTKRKIGPVPLQSQQKSKKQVGQVATTVSKAQTQTRAQMQSQSTVSGTTCDELSHISLPTSVTSAVKPHQVSGIRFLWTALDKYKGCILADEMGLGKTLMTIAVICGKHREYRNKHFVVVCPSSLVRNWAKEFDKWLGVACQPKRVAITKGGEQGLQAIKSYCNTMKQQKNQPGQVLIISYDLFRLNVGLFNESNKEGVALLVVDEAHRLKNTSGSQTLTALESLQTDGRICITATPIQNNLSEFYNLVNFSCPGLLGDYQSFRREYERPISAGNNKCASIKQKHVGETQSTKLERLTNSILLRRLQKDILTSILPPRYVYLVFCRPSAIQSDMYKSVVGSNTSRMDSDALATLTKLRKVCTHPSLLDHDQNEIDAESMADIACSSKMQVLDTLLQSIRRNSPSDKVVVVSNFTSALGIVEDMILKRHGYAYFRLEGSTNAHNRQAIVDQFNRFKVESCFVLLLSSKAGGCGLNLVGSNRLVMLDPDWNPASDLQAMARVYRHGQTKECHIYRLFTSGTVEEIIYQRQNLKGNLATMTVDKRSGAGGMNKFSKEELQDCFTLKENCACDTKVKLGTKWRDYVGPVSLSDAGCHDESTTQCMTDLQRVVVGHVQVVKGIESELPDVDDGDGDADRVDMSDDDDGNNEEVAVSEGYASSENEENEF